LDYDESIDWLYGTQTFGIKLGLENVSRLLEATGMNPLAPGTKIIHVAGTNGKGSVCAFAERILRDGGLVTGLFTSPHLVTYRERIRVGGEMIPETAVATVLSEIRDGVESWETHPTFFEISLALAMRHFRERKCEAVVLETGLGGRLDATNAIASDVSVITPISLDHSEWLGETIREVAGEKAGIIKPDTPVVVAELHPDARDVVGRRALEVGAPCIEAHPLPPEWNPGIPGPHQRENAALAVEAACRVEGDRLTRDGIRESVERAHWPGRFHCVGENLVLDGAHNPEAAASLCRAWREVFGEERAHLVFGAAESKDVEGIFRALLPIVGSVTLTPVRSERRLPPEEMRRALERAGGGEIPVDEVGGVGEVLEQVGSRAERTLVAGSLFLVGEALGQLGGADFEVSMQ